jgi:hypothetical protein
MPATGLLRRTGPLTGREAQSTAFCSLAWDRRVVFGRRKQDRVGLRDIVTPVRDRERRGGLIVLVEGREELHPSY